jgi:hypothetical protein
LLKANRGGIKQDLLFMEVIRNERIFECFSLLIIQQVLSEDYFYFWKEMKDSYEGALFDVPPYNLQTNIHAINGNRKVAGYFGVVEEQATRWYFSKEELSYWVENTLKPDCLGDPPSPQCTNCQEYINGEAISQFPAWWR